MAVEETMDADAPPPGIDTSARGFVGSLIADAVAMPVHWYYDRRALARDYGAIAGYLPPRNPHPDSILWRSRYVSSCPETDILGDQAALWGQRGVHYHQRLRAGENTLNQKLALELYDLVRLDRDYHVERWLERYVRFMLKPAVHRDTYVEECHRDFFTNLGAGRKPINCGVADVHIGGLVPVPALVAGLGSRRHDLRRIVREHVGLTHKDPEVLEAADAFTRILVRVTRGERLRTAILEQASRWISAAKLRQWETQPDDVVVGRILSPACYIHEAFPAALFLSWRYADDFAAGVCVNAQLGGDNCHRGAVVGALLGATCPIPAAFLAGLRAADRVTI